MCAQVKKFHRTVVKGDAPQNPTPLGHQAQRVQECEMHRLALTWDFIESNQLCKVEGKA